MTYSRGTKDESIAWKTRGRLLSLIRYYMISGIQRDDVVSKTPREIGKKNLPLSLEYSSDTNSHAIVTLSPLTYSR